MNKTRLWPTFSFLLSHSSFSSSSLSLSSMAMAASFHLQSLHSSFINKSQFLTQTQKPTLKLHLKTTAKFNLFEILGGRGLLNGEQGIEQELKKTPSPPPTPPPPSSSEQQPPAPEIPEDGFDKELLGLTGGFPGGEKGLQKFIQENPPPPPTKEEVVSGTVPYDRTKAKTKAPELPLLLPGMIAIVKNPKNPFHMYCGIVQRITDGKAGVLFEGGNWDKLVTFRLDELERREKGPPMVNPRSAILENVVDDN